MKHPYQVQFIKTSEKLRWIILEDAWSVRTHRRASVPDEAVAQSCDSAGQATGLMEIS